MKTLRNFLCGFVMLTALTATAAEKYRIQDQAMASWYGTFHQGRRMANGDRFDRRKLTAASRTLPLGTRVLVSFNGRMIVLTITDRGPYHHPDRVIDLSEAAATWLGLRPYGVALVTISPVEVQCVN